MYIEYDQFDKWCLFCTNCKRRTKLLRDAILIDVVKDKKCDKCGSKFVYVELENPFLSGENNYTGCILCDPNLSYITIIFIVKLTIYIILCYIYNTPSNCYV